jgi:type I restriction enzyme, S subunit
VTSTNLAAQRKLKYIATINDEALGEDTDEDFEMQYVDISNVDSSGRIGELATYRFAEAPSRARRRVRDGDVIISTVRTYLQAIAQISRPPVNLIASTGFAIVRPQPDDFDARYCSYALREPAFLAEVEKRSVGISYPAINRSDLASIPVCIHSLTRQRVIADYLDRETARIDALIAAKERLLELLAEKRQTLITRAVTHGLSPDVPMRDSGIPWLGEIPLHWKTKRMKYLFRLIAEPAPEGNVYELLSLYTDTGVRPRRELEERGNKASTTDNYWMVHRGDLIVNKLLAWMGAFGVSEYNGVTSPAYDVLRPLRGVESFYYHYLFRCGICQTEIRRRSYGVMDMRLRLYFDRFGDMLVPVPPISEQESIATQIAHQMAKFENICSVTEQTIVLLKERRSALITAAVNGQIDVGGVP